MSLFLIRHAETALNAARVLQPADTPLSPTGLLQSAALARRLARLGLAAIVSSDLPRALRTAEAIAAATGLEVAQCPLLRERDFGELRGQPYDTLGFDPLAMTAAPPGGESALAFTRRVEQAFAGLVTMRAALPGPLAIVTHGLVIRAILAAHAELPGAMQPPPRIANTSLTIVAAAPPHEVALLDSSGHLDAGLRDDAASLSGG
jgi:2,3-bisphosphoglycerate-dependent phosphoglycerate mutase